MMAVNQALWLGAAMEMVRKAAAGMNKHVPAAPAPARKLDETMEPAAMERVAAEVRLVIQKSQKRMKGRLPVERKRGGGGGGDTRLWDRKAISFSHAILQSCTTEKEPHVSERKAIFSPPYSLLQTRVTKKEIIAGCLWAGISRCE
ncbi:hypothetical protein PR202_ga30201 [Eleusine coracana subsp. coracana]|uniref:Multiprotein bridging factor 1 N-terminal domain-containing protein n=1 Tax=Eleusine coracana subsp. coracana TaxID=191504 RepID=A0AAV5DP54_ELECO|nr:hypothetical protein PR202_ga30201 [Eleusine coracana subsp. coracana]